MNKSSPTPNRTKIHVVLFILTVLFLGFLTWALQDMLGLKIKKINLTGVIPDRSRSSSSSIYDSYAATVSSGDGDAYYTKLTNVICDAAPSKDGQKKYFRISVTFESKDKKSSDTLIKSTKVLVEDLRETVSAISVDAPDQAQVMNQIRGDLGRKLRSKFGDTAISGIYFEEIIKQ